MRAAAWAWPHVRASNASSRSTRWCLASTSCTGACWAASDAMSQTRPFALQVRSSAGLYGADRVVLALNHALPWSGARGRLLSINNYRMHEQALHDTASATGQDAVLLPCRGRVDPATVGALAAQIGAVRDRDGTPPIVHVHDYKSAFYAWLATRREVHHGMPAPLVATLHGWVEGSTSLRLYTRLELAL